MKSTQAQAANNMNMQHKYQELSNQVKPKGFKTNKKGNYLCLQLMSIQQVRKARVHHLGVTISSTANNPKNSKGNHSSKKLTQGASQSNTPETNQKQKSQGKQQLKENANGQPQGTASDLVLDLHRKKSLDFNPSYSKSTKASPTMNGVQQQLNNNLGKSYHKDMQMKQGSQFKMDGQISQGNQYSLRIPLTEQDRSSLINQQIYNEIDSISPSIISHTQFVKNKYQPLGKKDQNIISGGNTINGNDLHFDNSQMGGSSSVHQSFINLIYPSMAKKLITSNTNENTQEKLHSQKQQSVVGTHGTHHSKSKSLFVGAEHVAHAQIQFNVPTVAGVQKVNQSSYKKQSNVFNYSQRLKQILNDSNDVAQTNTAQNFALQPKKHLFSQQPSPTHSSTNILVNMNDIQACHLQKNSMDIQLQKASLKNSFENVMAANQYLTLNEQASNFNPNAISQTLDIYLQNKQPVYPQHTKSITQQNTPNNLNSINLKPKLEGQPSKTHIRKPSNPIMKNNYMGENQQEGFSFTGKRDSVEMGNHSIERHNLQQQPQREKKQHQPSQAKPQKQSFQHQRSSSDYLSQTSNQGHPQPNMHVQAQKLKKFLNSAASPEEEEVYDEMHNRAHEINSQGITPKQYNIFQQQETSNTRTHGGINSASNTATTNNGSFLQQYSQALMDAQVVLNKQLKGDKSAKNSFINDQQQNVNSQTIQHPDSKTIYHQRKLSYQPQCQTLQQKKSPNKPSQQQFLFKDHYQKLAKKSKASPQTNLNHQYSQLNHNTSRHSFNPNQKNMTLQGPSQQTFQMANSLKNSQVTSPVSNNYSQVMNNNNVSHQVYLQNSMNQALKFQQLNNSSQHSSSAAVILINNFKQNTPNDIKNQIIQQATKKYQDQLLKKNTTISQSKQNLMPQSNNHISIKKPVQSEKASPRQQSKNQNKKNIANVSIDLYKGTFIHHPQQQQSQTNFTKQYSKNSLQRSSIGTTSDSQPIQPNVFMRKNSFVQQNQQQVQLTHRQQSPNCTINVSKNKSSVTLNPPPETNSKSSGQSKGYQRHSVQNSPQKSNSLFQKQQKNSHHQKNQSMINIQHPQNINYIIKSTNISPNSQNNHNKSISFTNFKNGCPQNVIEDHLSESDYSCDNDSVIMFKGDRQKASKNNNAPQYEELVRMQQRQASNEQNVCQQALSETEFLLNQIRSNIIQQKFNKKNQDDDKPFAKKSQMSSGNYLCKITEASVEQLPQDTGMDFGQYSARRNKQHLNIHIDDSQHFLYQTTDPSMSPYSKDLMKLKKMITFNFKKFQEPPVTTSEFYRIGRVLGRGAFGKVNLAAHKLSEQLAAIKSINKEFLKSEEDQRKKIMQEFAILKQSNHKSVVRLYDTFETNKHICFVMELCSGGDLLTYVRKRRKLKEDVAKYFFKQIIEGLAYIHNSKLIVHRDIKLDNILLDANGKIKICDFGVSKQVSSDTERMTEQCGTPAYIAPEILKDKGYEGFKVDIWSAGVCLYAMLVGTVPFKAASMHELHHLIINAKYELKEEKLSESAQNLIKSLLEVDWRKRLSACEVLNHPWLKDAVDEMDIFTQKEKDTIQKEYLSKNIDRVFNKQINHTQQETEGIFTEHNLDTKTNQNSLLKNASTKSIILAPFNSTVSDYDENNKDAVQWPPEVKQMIVPKRCIKFNPKCKDIDRQYEQNNNADLDNGVYNNFNNDEEDQHNSQSSSKSSSQDSLKKSFKETELSSDDERAEKQVEETRAQKLQQQSELQEFENQIKMKYVKYQEPVEIINMELVDRIVRTGVYPKEYLLKVLETKEMNYATATYHLLLKKQQIMQHLFSEEKQ